jgi:hypothetical protein
MQLLQKTNLEFLLIIIFDKWRTKLIKGKIHIPQKGRFDPDSYRDAQCPFRKLNVLWG